ncbi:hypothetical protein B0J18DRAFT_381969 [Chaetomium sp. MPI-SDFR-AT-0129]|nr:hypothetical protein B0J18DRAFT_381969 [Chaetomium sp. MPI-SDFR-AT-0129]
MKVSFACLVGAALNAGFALASGRSWQPAKPATAAVGKRSYVINTDRTEGDRMPWPNRKIRYCYENDEAQDALETILRAGLDIWRNVGLGSEFTMVQIDRDECREKRWDTLMIYWSGDNGGMATFAGLPREDSPYRDTKNPEARARMILTTSTSMGMLDQQKNFAHEIGHAWGLYHEHQNPAFWSKPSIVNGRGGTVFGPENDGNWRCENLKDYEVKVHRGLIVQNPGKPAGDRVTGDLLCKDQVYASNSDFSAGDYLPMPKDVGSADTEGMDGESVDWGSIMIYPSGAGGRGEASPGNDQRLPILLDHNGDPIKISEGPTQRDIAAMHKLYGRSKSAVTKDLLQKAGGKVTEGFKKIYPKSQGNSGGSACL